MRRGCMSLRSTPSSHLRCTAHNETLQTYCTVNGWTTKLGTPYASFTDSANEPTSWISAFLQGQEYPTEALLRLSAPRAEILLAGNLNRELKSWLGIYPKCFSYCNFCLNVVPDWKQQLSLPL